MSYAHPERIADDPFSVQHAEAVHDSMYPTEQAKRIRIEAARDRAQVWATRMQLPAAQVASLAVMPDDSFWASYNALSEDYQEWQRKPPGQLGLGLEL